MKITHTVSQVPCCAIAAQHASIARLPAQASQSLMAGRRVGDVYPNNVMEVHVRAYLYRWRDTLSLGANDLAYEVGFLNMYAVALQSLSVVLTCAAGQLPILEGMHLLIAIRSWTRRLPDTALASGVQISPRSARIVRRHAARL